MQALNLSLFEWIGAGHHPHSLLLSFATALAERGWWMCIALLGWVAWKHPTQRAYVLAALAAAAAASLAAHALAESIAAPRPFMLGLSPPHIEHGQRGSMPSAHASVMFSAGLIFLMRPSVRHIGWALVAVALLVGWARVYVGVHFPLDIVGGLLLGAVVAGIFRALQYLVRRFIVPVIARDDAAATAAKLATSKNDPSL